MARKWTRNTDSVQYNTAGQPFQNFAWGTIAAMVRPDTSSVLAGIIGNTRSDGEDDGFALYIESSDTLEFWCATTGAASRAFTGDNIQINTWNLVGVTKATGSVAPRFHSHRFDTQEWFHTGGNNTGIADNTDFKLPVQIGRLQTGLGMFAGHIAAVMVVNRRVMTDSEIERLVSGRWDRWIEAQDDFLQEFPGGRDNLISSVATVRSADRGRMFSTTVQAGTRADVTDPPGFRFSRLTRRR